MVTKQFGEVELIRDECPKGTVLREDEYGVVLEEYLDNYGKRVDVLCTFEKNCTLQNKEDLYNCLVEARKYKPNLNVPIYIKVESKSEESESEEQVAKNIACYVCVVEHSRTHPWDFVPRKKCIQCDNTSD